MVLVSDMQAASPPASLVMIPPQINYQGRLVTPTNSPYADAVHTIDLTLYPAASGGSNLWSERYSVQTRDGYFSVNLGSGGTGLRATNPPIWQVLWKDSSDANSPDTFYMALTVRTDQNGNPLSSPAEATPRQQFLTAPFAYRAHQSVYAANADGLFNAPQGVQTPLVSSLTNNMIISSLTNIAISAKTLDLLAAATMGSLMVNSKPLFVMTEKSATTTTGVLAIQVYHTISTTDYDVMPVCFDALATTAGVKGVTMNPNYPYASVYFTADPGAGKTIRVRFLGIRKGVINHQ